MSHAVPTNAPRTRMAGAAEPAPVLQRKCGCGGSPGPTGECPGCRRKRKLGLQPKLRIGPPGDRYEREADRIAAGIGARALPSRAPAINRLVQRAGGEGGGAAPPEVGAALATAGHPLEVVTRRFMEPRIGRDLSAVRVHSDAAAAASARAVGARAYTVGRDVVFGSGEYRPRTAQGRQLLAHELVHVVQQGFAGAGRIQRHPLLLQRQSGHGPVAMNLACDALLAMPEAPPNDRPSGTAVHAAVGRAFRARMGSAARPVRPIPGASFRESALTCGDAPPGSTEAAPRPTLAAGRTGEGRPDLVYRRGSTLEIAELKPAHPTCIPEAEQQVRNYVDKGNAAYNSPWRRNQGLIGCALMPVGRTSMTRVLVGGRVVHVAWCEPGVMVYKTPPRRKRRRRRRQQQRQVNVPARPARQEERRQAPVAVRAAPPRLFYLAPELRPYARRIVTEVHRHTGTPGERFLIVMTPHLFTQLVGNQRMQRTLDLMRVHGATPRENPVLGFRNLGWTLIGIYAAAEAAVLWGPVIAGAAGAGGGTVAVGGTEVIAGGTEITGDAAAQMLARLATQAANDNAIRALPKVAAVLALMITAHSARAAGGRSVDAMIMVPFDDVTAPGGHITDGSSVTYAGHTYVVVGAARVPSAQH